MTAWKTDKGSPVSPGQCSCTQVCMLQWLLSMTVALNRLITLHILLIWHHLTIQQWTVFIQDPVSQWMPEWVVEPSPPWVSSDWPSQPAAVSSRPLPRLPAHVTNKYMTFNPHSTRLCKPPLTYYTSICIWTERNLTLRCSCERYTSLQFCQYWLKFMHLFMLLFFVVR